MALTWQIQTTSGKQNIIPKLYDNVLDVTATLYTIDPQRTKQREVIRAGKKVIEVILKFKTKFGQCEGVARLYEDVETPRTFKAWNFLTALSDLNSSFNKKEDEYENNLEGPNWLDVRTEDRLYKDREPEVLVVGSGQAGLSIAARLKQQNIDTLVIDKNERVGDNWRNRYHSLKPVSYTHLTLPTILLV